MKANHEDFVKNELKDNEERKIYPLQSLYKKTIVFNESQKI